MSFLNRMFTCPCKTRACQLMRARRVLMVLIAGALIAVQALIMTNTIHDPISGETPAGTSWIAPQAQTVMQAASQLEPTSVGSTTAAKVTSLPAHHVTVRLNRPWTCSDPYAMYWVHIRGTHRNFAAVCITLDDGVHVLQPASTI